MQNNSDWYNSKMINGKLPFWIEVMKENETYYREQELKEKRKLRKIKLEKINENR
jgi:hypothetical protein